jgi:hypothetical protein
MALIFDVRPTYFYTQQLAIADRGNVINNVVMRKKRKQSTELSRIPN